MSGAILTRDLATELSSQGHQVYVASGDSTIDQEFTLEKDENIQILRVRTSDPRNLSLPMRLLHEIGLQKKIWLAFSKTLNEKEIDLAVVHSPTIFWHVLLKKLKKKYDLRVYLILRDLFPQWILDTKLISSINPVYWFMKYREIQLYKHTDIIGVQSKSNLGYFENKQYLRNFKVEVLYNWKIIGEKSKLQSNIREELKIEDKTLFVFGGNLGFAQDIDNLIRLIHSMQAVEDFHFLFIGAGTQFQKIREWIDINNTRNVSLLNSVSNDEYQSILNDCDVGVISLRHDFKTDNFPNKLLNYLEYKLPILASINPDNELFKLIEEREIGLPSNNGDDNQFLKNAETLTKERKKRGEMGKQGYKLLKEIFDVKVAAKKILKVSDRSKLENEI